MVNTFLALLGSFGAVWIYFDSGGEDVTEREAWSLVGGLGDYVWAVPAAHDEGVQVYVL